MEPTLEERIDLMEELLTPIFAFSRGVHDHFIEFEFTNHKVVLAK